MIRISGTNFHVYMPQLPSQRLVFAIWNAAVAVTSVTYTEGTQSLCKVPLIVGMHYIEQAGDINILYQSIQLNYAKHNPLLGLTDNVWILFVSLEMDRLEISVNSNTLYWKRLEQLRPLHIIYRQNTSSTHDLRVKLGIGQQMYSYSTYGETVLQPSLATYNLYCNVGFAIQITILVFVKHISRHPSGESCNRRKPRS